MKDKTITKPWGKYVIFEKKNNFWIKKIFVRNGSRLSLQSHKNRSEVWVILSGLVLVEKGDLKFELNEGEFIKINKNEKHRISGIKDSWIIEVALGQAQERDIVRYEDDYGRIKS